MKEIIIIGTLHGGHTPKDELEEVLNTINPDKVLIELSPEELHDRPREDSFSDEMFTAYDWAINNSKQIDVFDVENNSLKEGVTGKEQEFIELQTKYQEFLKQYSWKDLNKQEPWIDSGVAEMENFVIEKYFIEEEEKKRDFSMIQNIKEQLIDGVNVVFTGTGHLTFFKEQIPEAKLLFRD